MKESEAARLSGHCLDLLDFSLPAPRASAWRAADTRFDHLGRWRRLRVPMPARTVTFDERPAAVEASAALFCQLSKQHWRWRSQRRVAAARGCDERGGGDGGGGAVRFSVAYSLQE